MLSTSILKRLAAILAVLVLLVILVFAALALWARLSPLLTTTPSLVPESSTGPVRAGGMASAFALPASEYSSVRPVAQSSAAPAVWYPNDALPEEAASSSAFPPPTEDSPLSPSPTQPANDGSPEAVFREALQAFYDAQTYEDYKAATVRYSDSEIVQQALATPDEDVTPQQKQAILLAAKMILPVPDSVRDVRTEIAGDAATITATVQGSERPVTVFLVRENGVWKWHQLRVNAQ